MLTKIKIQTKMIHKTNKIPKYMKSIAADLKVKDKQVKVVETDLLVASLVNRKHILGLIVLA